MRGGSKEGRKSDMAPGRTAGPEVSFPSGPALRSGIVFSPSIPQWRKWLQQRVPLSQSFAVGESGCKARPWKNREPPPRAQESGRIHHGKGGPWPPSRPPCWPPQHKQPHAALTLGLFLCFSLAHEAKQLWFFRAGQIHQECRRRGRLGGSVG